MNKVIAGLAIAMIAGAAAAKEPASTVLQACEALKRQSDRNKCLEEAVKALSASAQQKAPEVAPTVPVKAPEPSKKEVAGKRSENVFAAARALQSVLGLGISYNDYSPYLQKLAVEVGTYKSLIEFSEEREAARLLDQAISAYDDARDYWRADIDFYSRRGNDIAYAGSLPMQLAGVSHLVSKYSIPTRKSDIWGIQYGATRWDALSTIWKTAEDRILNAQAAIAFKEKESPKVSSPESPVSVAEKMAIPRLGNADQFAIVNAFAGIGRMVCGTISGRSDSSVRLFAVNPETGSTYIEGGYEWNDTIWPTFCK